ncbi:MAG TPA: tripartite tricarboxylate transporter substrate-binding protein, partial [Thermodesulfobacteriota bacterium]|nr:tripartite tricarboxylate transporter substrate-binding protein [Thermodesulfobacteriota bacterium]
GTINQLGMEGFAAVKGISIKHIPTQGDAGAIAAIVGGHVAAASGNAISYQPHADAGKVKCLAQFGTMRDKIFLPNVPTFKELGIDVVADLWRWVVVPKGVAPERVKILADAFQKALQDKEVLSALEKIQCPVSYIQPEGYAKVMTESEAAIMPLIKLTKLDK